MFRSSVYLLLLAVLLAGCSANELQAQVKVISQYEQAGFNDFLIDKAGVFHAVYQESTAWGKPSWIYYTTSANRGITWSKPVNISNDGSGNGAGYARILQDGSGQIYVIWKRFGRTNATYPVATALLEGPGGGGFGTLYYKVLSGGTWSQQVQLNEDEEAQLSWFASVSPQGVLYIFWNQVSRQSVKNGTVYENVADLMRVVGVNGTAKTAIVDLSTPEPPAAYNGAPEKKRGARNLQGYVDKDNLTHMLHEDADDGPTVVKYFNGRETRVVYTYPGYATRNTFNNPPRLMVDEKGQDHMIIMPDAKNLEDQQLWDVNLATNQTNVLLHLPETVGSLNGFQASQGPNGTMAVTFQSTKRLGNAEGYGLFYKNGVWKGLGLTNNAAKDQFMSKDFIGLGGWPTNITTSTTYHSAFSSVAYDATGRRSIIMLLTAYWIGGGYSTSNPSIVFVPIDK